MEFSRKEYWGGLPFHTLGNFLKPVVKPSLADRFSTTRATWKVPYIYTKSKFKNDFSFVASFLLFIYHPTLLAKCSGSNIGLSLTRIDAYNFCLIPSLFYKWSIKIHQYLCIPCDICMLSHFIHVQLFATLWSIAHQAPLSMGFLRQEYRSGLPFTPPGNLTDPGFETMFLAMVLYH